MKHTFIFCLVISVAPPTVLVPVGAIPMYQIQGLNGKGPVVIIPSLAPKVNAPIPIVPKPPPMTQINITQNTIATTAASKLPTQITNSQVATSIIVSNPTQIQSKKMTPSNIGGNAAGNQPATKIIHIQSVNKPTNDVAAQPNFQKNVQKIMNEINARNQSNRRSTETPTTTIKFSQTSPKATIATSKISPKVTAVVAKPTNTKSTNSTHRHMSVFRPDTYVENGFDPISTAPSPSTTTKTSSKRKGITVDIKTLKNGNLVLPKPPQSTASKAHQFHQILFTSAIPGPSSGLMRQNSIDTKLQAKGIGHEIDLLGNIAIPAAHSPGYLTFSSGSSKSEGRRSSSGEMSALFSDFSAGSHLSQLNFNSADLESLSSDPASATEVNVVMSQVKLDDRDKEIVDIIDEIETSPVCDVTGKKLPLSGMISLPSATTYTSYSNLGANAPDALFQVRNGAPNLPSSSQTPTSSQEQISNTLSSVKAALLSTIKARALPATKVSKAQSNKGSKSNKSLGTKSLNKVSQTTLADTKPLKKSVKTLLYHNKSEPVQNRPLLESTLHKLDSSNGQKLNLSVNLPCRTNAPLLETPKLDSLMTNSAKLEAATKTNLVPLLSSSSTQTTLSKYIDPPPSLSCVQVPTITFNDRVDEKMNQSIAEDIFPNLFGVREPLEEYNLFQSDSAVNSDVPMSARPPLEEYNLFQSAVSASGNQAPSRTDSIFSNLFDFDTRGESITSLLGGGLPQTPKSSVGGYGLGMDFEDLFSGTAIDL